MSSNFLQDDVSNKSTVQVSSMTKPLSLAQSRQLQREVAEIQGAFENIYNYLKEIDVLLYRVQTFAPNLSKQQPHVANLIHSWGEFRTDAINTSGELRNLDNYLGA